MEKIQSALAKARAERGTLDPAKPARSRDAAPGQDGVADTPGAAPRAPGRQTAPDAAWQALPVLSPDPQLMIDNRIVAADQGREAKGIDIMRTRVLQQMRDNGWRRLAITSPTAACGKSTIAINLAMSLHRQHEMRTVLAEVDLRRPTLSDMLGISQDQSFAHVLEGTRDFADNAVRIGDNLAISTSPAPWRTAAELLSGAHVPEALMAIETAYAPDVMLFDTPPMLATDDTMAFARHVDCVLLVAGAESTTTREIDICERDLASQTNVMGVVLNKCRYMDAETEYGYYS